MPDTTTSGLAAKLAPKLQQALDDARDDIVANAGGLVTRQAVKLALPVARREVPTLTAAGLDHLATELSDWSVADVLRWLSSVAEKKGLQHGRLIRELRSARP